LAVAVVTSLLFPSLCLQLKYPPLLDPRLEETAVGLAEVMRQLAGVASVQAAQTEEQSAALKSLEAPKPRAPAVQENGSSGSGKAGGAKSSGTGARAGKTQGGADDEEGSEPLDIDSGGSDEDEEVDSQAGSEDEGSEVLIDSGSDDDDEEEEEDDDDDGDGQAGEEEDDEMDPVMVAARKASSAGASTSAPSSAADRALVAAGGQDGGLLESGGVDGVQAAGGALGGGVQADDEAALCGSLFKGLVFFLSREVPREQLAFVIRWVTQSVLQGLWQILVCQ
jgi:pescadillo protein